MSKELEADKKDAPKVVARFVCFDGMTWPDPKQLGELAWRLTWSPSSVTREDQLLLASVIGAYKQMVYDPRPKRDYVSRVLRNTDSSAAASVETKQQA